MLARKFLRSGLISVHGSALKFKHARDSRCSMRARAILVIKRMTFLVVSADRYRCGRWAWCRSSRATDTTASATSVRSARTRVRSTRTRLSPRLGCIRWPRLYRTRSKCRSLDGEWAAAEAAAPSIPVVTYRTAYSRSRRKLVIFWCRWVGWMKRGWICRDVCQ